MTNSNNSFVFKFYLLHFRVDELKEINVPVDETPLRTKLEIASA